MKQQESQMDVFIESFNSDEEEEIRQKIRKKKMLGLPEQKLGHIRSSNQNTSNKGNKDAGKIIIEKFLELANLSEFELYRKGFGELADLTVTENNRYANRDKNNPSFQLRNETFWNFLVLLLLTGYNIRISERDFWCKSLDIECRETIL